jgi:hypothetical protein
LRGASHVTAAWLHSRARAQRRKGDDSPSGKPSPPWLHTFWHRPCRPYRNNGLRGALARMVASGACGRSRGFRGDWRRGLRAPARHRRRGLAPRDTLVRARRRPGRRPAGHVNRLRSEPRRDADRQPPRHRGARLEPGRRLAVQQLSFSPPHFSMPRVIVDSAGRMSPGASRVRGRGGLASCCCGHQRSSGGGIACPGFC